MINACKLSYIATATKSTTLFKSSYHNIINITENNNKYKILEIW